MRRGQTLNWNVSGAGVEISKVECTWKRDTTHNEVHADEEEDGEGRNTTCCTTNNNTDIQVLCGRDSRG
jgi:hypothetical protein